MKSFVSTTFIAAGLAVAVCGFTAQPAFAGAQDSATAINRPVSGDRAQSDLLDAEVASQRADWNESARLAELSYKAKPDLWNQFNLATAYQHTGRNAMAIPLYIDLAERGQFARTHPIFSNDGSWPAPMLPFIADEAAHRLAMMGAPIVPTPAPLIAIR